MWEIMTPSIQHRSKRDRAGAEVDCIEELLKIGPGSDVLDLCCGAGRHSIELTKRGHKVTAVDRTSAYLDAARKEAAESGLSIEFVESDMRDFSRIESYDVALNLQTSFGYFEDERHDRRVIENLHASLRKGGRLMIDIMGREVLARIFHERDWDRWDDGTIFLSERKITRNWTWIENKWTVIGQKSRREFTIAHRLYSANGLSELLRGCGFGSVEIYGDFTGIPYDDAAKRLVACAEK
jgi:SAM-dependent methyltransferase